MFLLSKKKTPLENSKGVNLRGTTLFFVNAQVTALQFPQPVARPILFPTHGAKNKDDSKRVNGRTRDWLPIDSPAPGPCSAFLTVPTHTKRGSLTGSVKHTLPITAISYTFAL